MKTRSVFALVLCLFLSFTALAPAQTPTPAVPAKDWDRIEKPESAGYSSARLAALTAEAEL